MFQKTTQYRVSYADTDQMGYMYYGHYARLYEIARTEALRQVGYQYKTMELEGIMMPVYDNYSKYLLPARYDDLLTIKVSLKALPLVRCEFTYEIYNEAQALLNKGSTTLVFVNMAENKLCKAPQYLLDLLKPYFN
jgi:acyl-CoA thioester hydrolase